MADTMKNTGKKSSSGKNSSKANKKTAVKNTASRPSDKKNAKPVKKREPYVPSEKEKKLRSEIKLLIAFAAAVLIELSCLGFLSPLGDYVSFFVFGCFGLIGYILPIIVFLGLAFLISNLNNRNAVIKFSAGAALLMLISSFSHLIFFEDYKHGAGYFYLECGRVKNGGGFFGSLIAGSLYGAIGMAGTCIVLALLVIVCLILITERSFIGGVKKGGKKIYKTAVNDVGRIRESAENYSREKNYQKNKRMNKKVRGVSLAKLNDPEIQDEDIHEITGEVPENASIRRGRLGVELEAEYDRADADNTYRERMAESASDEAKRRMTETEAEYEPEYKPQYTETEVKAEPKEAEPEEDEDEEGFFRPKERIDVRESAKAVMSRPLYTGESTKGTPPKAASEGKPKREASPSPSPAKKKEYILPKTTLLNKGTKNKAVNEQELRETAALLKEIFKNFGVNVEVTEYHRGPSVTRYEIQPEIGTRLSKITALADDIKLNLAASDIRIEPVPGKSTVGIEVPNKKRESVLIRDLIESPELMNNKSKIAFAAGMDIAGSVVVGDIAKMPHMLVAGTTGSGKSVFTNSIIQSILFRATPDEVRLIIVDPKVVEFGVYNGIPHLLQPVVTDPKLAANTLKWAVKEMSDRYRSFADLNVRDLKGYNEKMNNPDDRMPQIVIVIDELADLMMVAAKDVEEAICRLAQLARAAGIHLVIATQRPSVDVVTGLIKANIPSRVALSVSSGVDSRTVIDSVGAEKLLGNGDMLFYPSGYPKPVRLQGAFVSDSEVQKVVEFWKAQAGESSYDEGLSSFVASQSDGDENEDIRGNKDGRDEYFADAARFCIEKKKASVSMVQRMCHIGFNRASRIIDQLEEAGVIGADEGTKPRKILMTIEEFEQTLSNSDRKDVEE